MIVATLIRTKRLLRQIGGCHEGEGEAAEAAPYLPPVAPGAARVTLPCRGSSLPPAVPLRGKSSGEIQISRFSAFQAFQIFQVFGSGGLQGVYR